MSLDIERLRNETPGTRHRLHLNSAGASLMPEPVVLTVTSHLKREAEIGGYEAAYEATERLAMVYTNISALVNANPEEIALTGSPTQAWQMAFYSQRFAAGDRVLTSQIEYAANYVAFLQMKKHLGITIDVIPSDPNGVIDVDSLEAMLDERVRLIAITWVPTNSGLINPAAQVGKIARRHGIRYLLDGCQALGQLAVDVRELGCDWFTATGRKFLRGPRGTGFLFVRRELLDQLEPPMLDHFGAPWTSLDQYTLRKDARRFETWEASHALRLGLGEAARYALSLPMREVEDRCQALADRLREGLSAIPKVKLYDQGARLAAIVSFSVDGRDVLELNRLLFQHGINVSHALPAQTLLDSRVRNLPPLLRASPHYFNTDEDVDLFIVALRRLV